MDTLQLNSTTFVFAKESEEYKKLEGIVTKLASSKNIEDVSTVEMSITKESSFVKFKQAGEELSIPIPDENESLPPAVYGFWELLNKLHDLVSAMIYEDDKSKRIGLYNQILNILMALPTQADLRGKGFEGPEAVKQEYEKMEARTQGQTPYLK